MEKKEIVKYSALALLGIVGSVLAFKAAKKITSMVARKSNDSVVEAEKGIKITQLTKPESWYKQNADRLYIAMKGVGTNTKMVFEVLSELENQSDWNKLISAYGVRESSYWLYSFRGNLIEWLEDELSHADSMKVKQMFSNKNIMF